MAGIETMFKAISGQTMAEREKALMPEPIITITSELDQPGKEKYGFRGRSTPYGGKQSKYGGHVPRYGGTLPPIKETRRR